MSKFTMTDLVSFLRAARETVTDEVALQAKDLYKEWKPDMVVKAGERLRHGDKLYKVREGKAHTTQVSWTPDKTPDLFTVIDVVHAGTLSDPIPASAGMEYEYGKYYIEGDTVYICKRQGEVDGGKVTLQHLPSELVGHYFEVVN